MLTRMFWVVGLAVLLPATVLAASFSVTPVRVDLAAERPYMVMQITNTADVPVTLQARVYRWTESDMAHGGGLISTDDLILNPPLLTVLPQATRFLRLGLRAVNHGSCRPLLTIPGLWIRRLPKPWKRIC